ncbi:hypothetical protein TWF481_000795 [Arthrobotrys musiformis]|uniref:Uncharacterized protein n=1 Tax=Arthrobotrys musiformis TaxID=47236 RepID=A0AAV9WUC6_9PEZI
MADNKSAKETAPTSKDTTSAPSNPQNNSGASQASSQSGGNIFEKIVVRRLAIPRKEIKNPTLKTLQAGQDNKSKCFNVKNVAAGGFMGFMSDRDRRIEFIKDVHVDKTGAFFGMLGGSNTLLQWLNVIEPPLLMSAYGKIDHTTGTDSSLLVDLVDFEMGMLLNPTRVLLFTTQASAIKEQFGEVCGGESGLYAYPGHLLFALSPGTGEEATVGLSDLIQISGLNLPSWLRAPLDVVKASSKPGKTGRSGLWMLCGIRFDTFLRLEMELERSNDDTGINKFLNQYIPSLKLEGIKVILKRRFMEIPSSGPKFDFTTFSQVWLQAPVMEIEGAEGGTKGAMLSVGLGSGGLSVSLQWNEAGGSIKSIGTWLNKRIASLGGNDSAFPELTTLFKESFSTAPSTKSSWLDCIHIRRLNLDFSKTKIYNASVMFEVDLPVGAPRGGFNTIVLSARMKNGSFTFRGMLLGKNPPKTLQGKYYQQSLDPLYEVFTSDTPWPARKGCQEAIQLKYLDPDNPFENIPSWLPNEIHALLLEVEYSAQNTRLTFETTFGITAEMGGDLPIFQIKELNLFLEINKPKGGAKQVAVRFDGTVNIYGHGAKSNSPPVGRLDITLQYQTPGSWLLRGGLHGIKMSSLATFFDATTADIVVDIFKNVYLHELIVEYMFSKGGSGTLGVNARMVIANVDFSLSYKHFGKSTAELKTSTPQPGKINWLISAKAQPAKGSNIKNPKIRDWIADLIDEELAADLPGFVGNTEIPLDTLVASVRCFSVEGHTMFVFRLSIKGFGFEFAQIQKNNQAAPAKSGQNDNKGKSTAEDTKSKEAKSAPVRLLRIKLNAFPDCGNLPLVGEVKQPLEEIDFLWSSASLDRSTVGLFNTYIFNESNDKLNWKEPIAAGGTLDKADILIVSGFHFMVIMDLKSGPTVILDYVFGQKGSSKDSKSATGGTNSASSSKAVTSSSQTSAAKPSTEVAKQTDESKPSAPAPFEKKVGPLSIANLSLKYKNQVLTVVFDADVKLGPLQFALKGFGIELHLYSTSLHDLSKMQITASLSGLGMQVKQGKVTLAGLFEKIEQKGVKGYGGGLAICLPQYTFLGAGAYLEEESGYKSIFGILMVTGPLMHFGFAEVRGITGGFGYNSTLRIPQLYEMNNFPLLNQSLKKEDGPLDQLKNITNSGWIKPKKDTIWIAAGLTVKAFQLVDVQAVVTVEVGDDLKIAIVGRAIATAPPQAQPSEAFILVVLDVVASLDFGKGAFSLQGQLNPASFILDKACQPTGGFALCSWFGNSQYAGDWVFTIGGFHPAYQRPAHYPNPPRLGISWKYDSSISITGEAYFAITPQLCMGGGKLSINFDVGNISAYLTAYADFLINYKPFQYLICVGVKIGVSYTLKVWFVRAKFSVDISAQITIQGPPVSGTVYVDLKVISFTIAFGARRTVRKPLSLEEFWVLLVQSSTGDDKSNHIFGVVAGLVPAPKEAKESHLGSLRAGILELQVHSRAAISQITLGESQYTSTSANEIYAKPTREQSRLVSNLTATVTKSTSLQGEPTDESNRFQIDPIYKYVPSGLWARYDPNDDPSDDKSNTAALRSNKPTKYSHLMGFSIRPREPILSADKFPKFSVDTLLAASGGDAAQIKVVDVTPNSFLPGLKGTTKSKVRGVWGGNTTTTQVNINKVLKGLSEGFEALTKKESRYANLATPAPKQLFEDFDLIYSAGAPRLAGTLDNQPPDLVGGEWSTKWEKPSSYKISSVNRSSIDLERYANGIITMKPKLHFGINRIDFRRSPSLAPNPVPAPSYRFNTFIDPVKYEDSHPLKTPEERGQSSSGKVITIGAHSWSDSVLNECDITWLAIFDQSRMMEEIQTGRYSIGAEPPRNDIKLLEATAVPNPPIGSGIVKDNLQIFTKDIAFPKAYTRAIPKVTVWITSANISGSGDPKIKVEAPQSEITKTGFKVKFTVWGESKLEGIGCSWLAHPDGNQRRIQSGVFSTMTLRNAFSPRKITTDRVNFENFKFERIPTVLVAFNHIECSRDSDFRAGVTVSGVKTNGFVWHCSTWGFADLHAASAAYVAFDA